MTYTCDMRRSSVVLFISTLLWGQAALGATSVIVDPGGGGDYVTIQSALDWAANGSDILITDGEYAEDLVHASGRHYTLKRRTLTDVVTLIGSNSASNIILQVEGSSVLDIHDITFDGDPNSVPFGIYCSAGQIHAAGCTFNDLWGAGIKVTGLTYGLQIQNCVFVENEHGLDFEDMGTPMAITIGGCEFTNNGDSWSLGGGAIRCLSTGNFAPSLYITNSLFQGNESRWGGAINLPSLSSLHISGCTFVGNRSGGAGDGPGGGAVRLNGSIANAATVTGCVFVGNTAEDDLSGGALGIQLGSYSRLGIDSCVFAENTALNSGGGAVNVSTGYMSSVRIDASQFLNNSAGGGASGGGLLVDGEGTVDVADTLFCGNIPDPYSGTIGDDGGNTYVDTCQAGACCIERVCAEVTADACQTAGGLWFGVGASCSEIECDDPIIGACCLARYCATMGAGMCDHLGGVFHEYATCHDVVCTVPPFTCIGDLDYDGQVNIQDLLTIIDGWGPCP
jgi:hypothetical protein